MSLTEEKIKEMVAKIEKDTWPPFSSLYEQQAQLLAIEKKANLMAAEHKAKKINQLDYYKSALAHPLTQKFYQAWNNTIVTDDVLDPAVWAATSHYAKGTTVSNDIGLGRELKQDRPRDAVHIACAPVTLGEWMQPGVPVIVRKGEAFAAQNHKEKPIGVIDPFLPGGCPKGARVWLMLNPGSITSLRHDWTHPAFAEEVQPTAEKPAHSSYAVLAAQNTLRTMGKRIGKTYAEMLKIGDAMSTTGYAHVGQEKESEYMNDHKRQFWNCWSIVTGNPVPSNDTYFSCAC